MTLRTVTSRQDPAVAQVADLIAAAVERREAIGLVGPLTAAEYGTYLAGLIDEGTRGDGGLVVAEIDDAVAGTAQWRRSPYRTRAVLAELDRVSVAPGHRGAGLGRALVDAVAADATDHGIEVLSLEVRGNNHAAIALYDGCGFRRTGRIENAVADGDARHDVVLMTRELARPPQARLLGALPAGAGASLPRGVTEGETWLRTDRLLLCRPEPADLRDHHAIHADPATNVHNPAGPQTDLATNEQQLAAWSWHWRKYGYGYWTVRLAATGEVIGFGGVRPAIGDENGLNLAYRFRPTAWGNGYAQELARAALDLARAKAPGEPVVALIVPANTPSIKVAERLGLRLEGPVQRELGEYLRYTVVP